MEEDIKVVDFGVSPEGKITLVNEDTGLVEAEFDNGLDAAMWIGAHGGKMQLVERAVDYEGDDGFDDFLEGIDIG